MKDGAITDRMMELAEKWLKGSISEQEKAEFTHWYNQFNDESATVPVDPAVLQRDMLKEILTRVHAEKRQPSPMVTRPVRKWMRYAAVAAGLLLVSSIGYFLLHKKGAGLPTPLVNKPHSIQDIAPGKQKAVLTLADGTGIVLDSAHDGAIALQGKTTVSKKENGLLEYRGPHSPVTTDYSPIYNTLTTPRGGQYQLVLPDGSKVWLNAASSIRYPTAFTGNERRVEITGEAYFEVSKVMDSRGQKISFVVDILPPTGGARGGRVEVLGTHFNINAYEDESAIQTTLLQGSVKVGKGQSAKSKGGKADSKEKSVILKPGEQVSLSHSSQLSHPIPVETDEVLAWKNGRFQFHNAGVPAVLRQISRWYDVDIRYEGDIPVKEFEGKIQRNLTLLQVLKILEKNQVHVTLEGRTIIVKNTK